MAEETSWTEERLEKLKLLWDTGLSISQIGEQLGVTRNAVAGKAHRLKLPKRQSPISKTERQKTKALSNVICLCVLCCVISNGLGPNVYGRQVTRRQLSSISVALQLCPENPIVLNIAR